MDHSITGVGYRPTQYIQPERGTDPNVKDNNNVREARPIEAKPSSQVEKTQDKLDGSQQPIKTEELLAALVVVAQILKGLFDKLLGGQTGAVQGPGGTQAGQVNIQGANGLSGTASNFDNRAHAPSFSKHNGGAGLNQQKTKVLNALEQQGATDREKYAISAMLQQESFNGKDHTDPHGNTSAFNISDPLIARMLGKDISQLTEADKAPYDNDVGEAAKLLLAAMRSDKMKGGYYGDDSFSNTLLWMRGGQTAFNDGQSFGAQGYIDAISTAAKHMKADGPGSLTDNTRYASNLPQVTGGRGNYAQS